MLILRIYSIKWLPLVEKYRLNTFHCKVDYNTSKWKLGKSMGWGEVNKSIHSQNTRQPLKVINVYLGKCSQFTFARKKRQIANQWSHLVAGGAVFYVNLSRIQIKGLLVITSRAWAWTRSSRKVVTFNFTLYNCTLFLFVKLDTYYFHSQKN